MSLNNSKIVGGSDAAENGWLWQVSIQRTLEDGTRTHVCGGTIYNYEFIITAAHCVNKYSEEVKKSAGVGQNSFQTYIIFRLEL